jgi:hypothetical protein
MYDFSRLTCFGWGCTTWWNSCSSSCHAGQKFPLSYFITFILYWSCLFLCDMHAGLLGSLQRIKLFTIVTFRTKQKTIQNVQDTRLIP